MATLMISLPDTMQTWVDSQASEACDGSASDHICDLIGKDQGRKEARAMLQASITEGVKSGETAPFDATVFKLRMRGNARS